jgi:sugar phosphate isomerase/epimerase
MKTITWQMDKQTRRHWLKLTTAAVVGSPLLGWAANNLKAKAKKNLKLAVFTGVYSRFPLEEAVKRIRADGFTGAVCEYAFADVRLDPYAPDWDAVKKVTDCFARQGVKIVGLYGYYNVVDPDPAKRRRGETRMQFLVENWKRLGSPIIATETGTFNRESEWNDSPENATEQGYQECREVFAKLARAAEKTGAIIAIEAYWKNVISSVERTERLFRDVSSPSLKLVMDPCNYFRKEDLPRMQPMLEDIFRRVGKQTVLAHAKDVKASATSNDTELPAAGQGVLDYPLYLRLLAGLSREFYVAIEHLSLEEVPRTRDFVLSQLDKV